MEPASVDIKLKLAEVEFAGFEGLAVMDVSGAVVSRVILDVAVAVFPAASVAVTVMLLTHSTRPVML